ncbi:MAG TPA: DUF6049 family protein [Streptosporangiaceae bacterium]|nr:DUF6049 family protein [Streptosporangiaceae bacterium]
MSTDGLRRPGRTVRRSHRALAAVLAVSALSAPAVLVTTRAASAAPAAGGRTTQPSAPVAIAITGMTPRQAAPGSTIRVTGTLKNASGQQLGSVAVRLLSSATALTSVAQLQATASEPDALADTAVAGASWSSPSLAPGATVGWSIRLKANAIGMTAFGVYPLEAAAQSTADGLPLASAATYLPYVPAKKGHYGSTIPARTKISWVWPLIDKPLLTLPGQSACQDSQAQALAASLGSGGRLGQLVAAGAGGKRTAITWAIDPALLANVNALAACGSSQPKWAAAARSWLARVQQISSAQPVFLAPYGDPNVSALIGAGHPGDVQQSLHYGDLIGRQILDRSTSAAAGSTPAAQGAAATIAWPSGGIPGDPAGDGAAAHAGYTVLQYLAADGIRTLVLGSSYLPDEHATVLRTPNGLGARTPNGSGAYMNILLADESLTELLSTARSASNSAFTTVQEFLAETALLAKQGEPIVVAPPQRWAPAPGVAAGLLAATGSVSWLSPVSLASLASAKNLPVVQLPSEPSQRMLNRRETRVLRRVDGKITQLELLRAAPDAGVFLSLAAAESSAWQGKSKARAIAALNTLGQRIAEQLRRGVQIEAEPRITLGGLKGSVPVSIDNTLGYAVAVRLDVDYDQSTGIKIAVSPGGVVNRSGLITIPAGNVVTIRLRVQATEVGATAVTLSLLNRKWQPLPGSLGERMTIQATQVGVLGVIIFAVALGIFLIATAARAARRGRPVPAPDEGTEPGLASAQAEDRPAAPPEPDTVMPERTELGAASTPGRD